MKLKLVAVALVAAATAVLTACDQTPAACAQGQPTYYDSATHTRKACP